MSSESLSSLDLLSSVLAASMEVSSLREMPSSSSLSLVSDELHPELDPECDGISAAAVGAGGGAEVLAMPGGLEAMGGLALLALVVAIVGAA